LRKVFYGFGSAPFRIEVTVSANRSAPIGGVWGGQITRKILLFRSRLEPWPSPIITICTISQIIVIFICIDRIMVYIYSVGFIVNLASLPLSHRKNQMDFLYCTLICVVCPFVALWLGMSLMAGAFMLINKLFTGETL